MSIEIIVILAAIAICVVLGTWSALVTSFTGRTGPPPSPRSAIAAVRPHQAWNELPHPQLFFALGLMNVKPRLSIPS